MTKEWERNRATILDYYKTQGKTLVETMEIMAERHNFRASTRAYRSRLKRWGVQKYNKPRQESAPAGASAGIPPTMAGSVPMATSVSYPGSSVSAASDPLEEQPSPSLSPGVFSPSPPSADFSYPQVQYDDVCRSARGSSPPSAVSPQAPVLQLQYQHPEFYQHQHQHQHQQYAYHDPHQHSPSVGSQQEHRHRRHHQQQQSQSDGFPPQGQNHASIGPTLPPPLVIMPPQQQQQHHIHNFHSQPAAFESWGHSPE